MTEEILSRSDEARRLLKPGLVPANVVEGASEGATLHELTRMVREMNTRRGRMKRIMEGPSITRPWPISG